MEHIYAVETAEQLHTYQTFVSEISPVLERYISYLRTEFHAASLPRTVLWTSAKIATTLISDIPVPAYTNDYRIVMTSDLESWRSIYLSQLTEDHTEIQDYYYRALNQHHILQILGHELVHHSEFFIDEAYDSGEGIWFEEGMAEYISRRYFLTEEEFRQEANINRLLVDLYNKRNGQCSLQAFGSAIYTQGFDTIFYQYWQSFLAVAQVVENHGGDPQTVFASYHQWYESGHQHSLAQWFGLECDFPNMLSR